MTAQLAEFLLARIAEDERHAQGAKIGSAWRYDDRTMQLDVGSDSLYWAPSAADHAADCDYEDHWECSDARRNAIIEGDHMVRWQPARVLAECEAKRRIVELHNDDREHYCPTEEDGSEYFNRLSGWAEAAAHPQVCPTLRLLALPYADHPDYREEWRP